MIKRTNQSERGFTLAELLVVIVVIGVLAAIAIPVFYAQRNKASSASAISDLRNVATAEESHFTDAGVYSNDVAALDADGLRQSPGVKLGIAVSTDGYCGVAQNGTSYWWFDSNAGGVQQASTTGLTPPTSASGSCSTAVPGELS